MKKARERVAIIGAGACGLMAARELAKAGKKVVVLEARNRIGGRIWPIQDAEFGGEAEAGAEFIHGRAKITRRLMKEAGLTYVPADQEETRGEWWTAEGGEFKLREDSVAHEELFKAKLRKLKKDAPLAVFFDKYFAHRKYGGMRKSVAQMVEGYDAADPKRVSTFSVREEWLSEGEWQQGRIKEGYGALLEFLELECRKNGVEILLGQEARSIEMIDGGVNIRCSKKNLNEKRYDAGKAIVTLPLGILDRVRFTPPLPEKMAARSRIGFGGVIKVLLQFKDQWWIRARGKNLSKMMFMFTDEKIPTWWTQYPDRRPLLTGWLAGPKAEKLKDASSKDILEMSCISLGNIFKIGEAAVRKKLAASRAINWLKDPHARGAYSYPTPETEEASRELRKPVKNIIFFAGEGIYKGKETATVEGALGSGVDVAKKILHTL